jgi:hypothetical protein
VQAPELFDDEKSDEDPGKAGDEEILPVLPEAHASQGNKIGE